jgi:transcriptional regulator with XRE-family HTH domain
LLLWVLLIYLKEARPGLSQKQLGIQANIDEFSASPRINQYERGRHTPDFETVERLAKVLKVPAAFFYTRDDDLAQLILHFGSLTRTKAPAKTNCQRLIHARLPLRLRLQLYEPDRARRPGVDLPYYRR